MKSGVKTDEGVIDAGTTSIYVDDESTQFGFKPLEGLFILNTDEDVMMVERPQYIC